MSNRIRLNVGTVDRLARAVLGAVTIALGLNRNAMPWTAIGLVLLLTAAVSFCPLYALVGFTTRPRKAP
jgi:Protein of unknown function (DUF2892)